jgi:hypothetical protein
LACIFLQLDLLYRQMTRPALSYNDLAVAIKQCSGSVPPPLVGASVSVLGTKIYVVAGRLVSNRQMTNDIYVLDKPTGHWERLPSGQNAPQPRYFHSASAHDSKIFIFGGMGSTADGENSLCVYNDLSWYDLQEQEWHIFSASAVGDYQPAARYAHLAVISFGKLIIIGGQDLDNRYLCDVAIFSLSQQLWLPEVTLSHEFGSYRSLAVALDPIEDQMHHKEDVSSLLKRQPYEVLLFSNYNFTDVNRELFVLDVSGDIPLRQIDLSAHLSGSELPPGLRFPSGFKCGQRHIIISGIFMLAHAQTFELWAFDLEQLTWTPIDIGSARYTGSWSKGCFCEFDNTFVMLGNQERSLAEDYNHRQANFEHMVSFDLEAQGIFSPIPSTISTIAAELGLVQLANAANADLDIVTQERTIISVSSRVLAAKWAKFRRLFREQATENGTRGSLGYSGQKSMTNGVSYQSEEGNRSRCLYMPYNHTIVSAFIRFLYCESLPDLIESSSEALCSLLTMAVAIDDLEAPSLVSLISVCKARLHAMLDAENAAEIYETCTLTRQVGLQVRALRQMLASRVEHFDAGSVVPSPLLSGK